MSAFVSSPSASNTDRNSRNPWAPQGLPGRGNALLLPRPCSQPPATPWPEEGTSHTDLPCLAYRTDALSPAGWEALGEPNIWRRAGTSMKAVPTSITSRLIHCHSGLSRRQGSSGGNSQKLGGPGLEASLLSWPSCLDGSLHGKAAWGNVFRQKRRKPETHLVGPVPGPRARSSWERLCNRIDPGPS